MTLSRHVHRIASELAKKDVLKEQKNQRWDVSGGLQLSPELLLKTNLRKGQDGSVSKGTCHHACQSVFNPQKSHTRSGERNDSSDILLDHGMCVHACIQ